MNDQRPELAFFVDAFEHSVRSLLALTAELAPEDWDRPTDLPGWSVRDVLAHLAAVETELLGRGRAPALTAYGPHVRGAFGRHMEDGVAARRGWPVEDVVAELAGALDERVAAMRAMTGDDPPQVVPAGQPWDTTTLLRNRAFDAWTHEQDVRRAVGRPGNLDGPGARLAQLVMTGALPYLVAKRAGAGPGQSVRLVVDGAVAFDVTVAVGPDGRAAVADGISDATATLRTDWATYVRLSGGRVDPDDAAVTVSGDLALADRLLRAMAITP
jgi:uncharacterized protein (TIGR03083 family)